MLHWSPDGESIANIRVELIAMASALEASYDDRQRTAQLVVCSQCGHQVYSTARAGT